MFISEIIGSNVLLCFWTTILFNLCLFYVSVISDFRPKFCDYCSVRASLTIMRRLSQNLAQWCLKTFKVFCSRHGRSSEVSFNNHKFLGVGQVGHNGALLATEFFHATFTPANDRLISLLNATLGADCNDTWQSGIEQSNPFRKECSCYFVQTLCYYLRNSN